MQRLLRLTLATSCGVAAAAPARARADDNLPPLSLSGFARLDVLADDSRMSDILAPMYVLLEGHHGHTDSELTMTPRLSRVALGLDGWQLGDHTTGEGAFEVDFAGSAGTNAIRLRQAYGKVSFWHLAEIVAGQTVDLISPLVPAAASDTQLVFAGNTGDRRPQLQLACTGEQLRVGLGLAANGSLAHLDADGDGRIDGMASARPMVQWLVEWHWRLHGDEARLGAWGHVANAELAGGAGYGGESFGIHAYVPLSRRLVVLGEGYLGSNLADIGGAIAQGYNPALQRTVRGGGGWLELAMLPTERHLIALGSSTDTALADDVDRGAPTRNSTAYGVVRYKPRTAVEVGVDYLVWQTRYKLVGYGIANRVDLHLSLLF
jgi:hypothetical protein